MAPPVQTAPLAGHILANAVGAGGQGPERARNDLPRDRVRDRRLGPAGRVCPLGPAPSPPPPRVLFPSRLPRPCTERLRESWRAGLACLLGARAGYAVYAPAITLILSQSTFSTQTMIQWGPGAGAPTCGGSAYREIPIERYKREKS